MFSASANAHRLDECESVAACLSALDDVAAQTSDPDVRESFDAIAEELRQRFADEARAELDDFLFVEAMLREVTDLRVRA